MGIEVLAPGFFSTIQDNGRIGYQQYGVVASGPMDASSYRLANLLVGNYAYEAALEITMLGPTLLFTKNTVISICGANIPPKINGEAVPNGKALVIKKGDILSFGKLQTGFRSYLAIAGGIQVPLVLGSRSTYFQARIGGFQGRKLEKGDKLKIFETNIKEKINWRLSPNFIHHETSRIRFIRGKQHHWFSQKSINLFTDSEYRIQPDSNRMGYRLKGHPLSLDSNKELVTEAVTFGSIQVPPNGQPIILMADRQTTGGYPKIAQVAAVDLPILAQKEPGSIITFAEVSLAEAQNLYIEQEKKLKWLEQILKYKLKGVLKGASD